MEHRVYFYITYMYGQIGRIGNQIFSPLEVNKVVKLFGVSYCNRWLIFVETSY